MVPGAWRSTRKKWEINFWTAIESSGRERKETHDGKEGRNGGVIEALEKATNGLPKTYEKR
jgi:hypothetical protein